MYANYSLILFTFKFQEHNLIETCSRLMNMDYKIMEIDNKNGSLSYNYPSRILIPENEIRGSPSSQQTIYENCLEAPKLREFFQQSRFARSRARFPVPVISFRGKYICRSSTLSGCPEMYGRYGYRTITSLFKRVVALSAGTFSSGMNIFHLKIKTIQ